MFESKAEMMKTIGNGANYVEFSCSRGDVKGMLIMPKPTPTRSIVAPKYHPGYGYPNAYRVQAIESAQFYGVSFAANAYNVHQSTIYRWIAASRPRRN